MRRIFTLVLVCCAALYSHAQCPQYLNLDTSICTGAAFSVTANAGVLKSQLCGDSVTILFNATGTTLSGDTNVYFHSSPELQVGEGWNGPTVGNWGLNDGVGRMTSVGTNLWSITINPRNYYRYSADSCLDGIWMVFRNFNGNKVTNNNGSNILLVDNSGTLSSSFAPISGSTFTQSNNITYLWSDGNTNASRTFTTATNLTVTATGVGGCTATGSVIIKVGHAPVTLGNDIVRCTPNTPTTLNAGSGFTTYIWLNEAPSTNSTYVATNPGCYWLTAIDAANCTSTAEIGVHNSEVNNLLIPDSLGTCPGGHISVNAATNVNLLGDSVVIIYNATQGQSGLQGATKVYFHSGPQFYANGGWEGNYTVGTFGVDNGVGEMTSLGNNLWRIAIDPYCYYHVNPDTPIIGLYCVFRNADGSQTGKDNTGNNIQVVLTSNPPTSPFSGVTPSRTARQPLTYNWSNNVQTSTDVFTTAGIYTVTLSDNSGCSATASIKTSFTGGLNLNLGADTTICHGDTVSITGPGNFAHYAWSTTATSQSIKVTSTGVYALTATDTVGCQSTGSRAVTISNSQVNIGNNLVQCTRTPVTLTANSGFQSYQWLNAAAGNVNAYTATNAGPYWIKAIDNFGCASYDTISLHFSDVLGLSLPDTSSACPGSLISLDANTSIEQNGDSLVIIYNATQGQSGLIGANKVYFHSGPQFNAGGTWVGNHTIGNWGQDDGVGKMDSLGNNMWRIEIDPYTYYHINPDTPLTGVYMVFRNANGSQTGKDNNGNNILLSLTGTVPTSTFSGIYGFHASAGDITYAWSNGTLAASTAISTPGAYAVTVSDNHGCSKSETVQVLFNSNLSISLGADTNICNGDTLRLTPGAGYAGYQWSNGASTASITVNGAGTYSVTVTNGTCSATGTINVTVHAHSITIGNNIVRCTTAPVTLTASTGFTSYHWFGATASSQTYTAVNPGSYWVKGIDASGCSSFDTITVANSSVLGLLLPDSFSSCGADTIHVDAATSINANGDSLTIVYNAIDGQTGLVGAAKVYMHSGPQFYASGGWEGAYTVGNWGMDDGVGEMQSLGNNKWTITIDPKNYYHVNPDTPMLGIYCVFRNANGTQTGKDGTGNNILLNFNGLSPVSTFNGITGSWKAALPLTYDWSNSVTTSANTFTAGGTYSLTVSDGSGCSASAGILVSQGQSPTVTLTGDTTVCPDSTIVIGTSASFASYVWNTGASTQQIYVTTPGTYTVTVNNSGGCSGSASLVIDSCNTTVVIVGCGSPIADFAVLAVDPGNTVTFSDSSHIVKINTFLWEFGDGTTSSDTGSVIHTYDTSGVFSVTLVITDSCGGADSMTQQVFVNVTDVPSIESLTSLSLYPNPNNGAFDIEVNIEQSQPVTISLINLLGQTVWSQKTTLTSGRNLIPVDATKLGSGIYTLELLNNNERAIEKVTIAR